MLTDLLTSSIRGAPAQTQPGKAQAGPGEGVFAAVLGALSARIPAVESEPDETSAPLVAEESTDESTDETARDVAQLPVAADHPQQAPAGEGEQTALSVPLINTEAEGMESEPFSQARESRASEPAGAADPDGQTAALLTFARNMTAIAEAEVRPLKSPSGERLQASRSTPEPPLPGPLPTASAASQGISVLEPSRQSTAESAASSISQSGMAASVQIFDHATGAPGSADNPGRLSDGMLVSASLHPSAKDPAMPGERWKADAPAKSAASAPPDGLPLRYGRAPADFPLMPLADLRPMPRASSLSLQPVLPREETTLPASAPPIQRNVAPGMAGLSDHTISPPTEWHRGDMTKTDAPRIAPSPAATGGNTPHAATQTFIALAPPATTAQSTNTLRLENSEGGLFLPLGDSPVVPAAAAGTGALQSLNEATPAHRQSAELARDISQQISAQVLSAGKGRFELSLAPAELGKVEMWLQESDNRLTLSVSAERPETMDLIRRHIGLLEQELRQMGFGGLSLQLGSNGAPASHGDRSPRNHPVAEGIAAPAEPLRRAATAVLAGERLDLRL